MIGLFIPLQIPIKKIKINLKIIFQYFEYREPLNQVSTRLKA